MTPEQRDRSRTLKMRNTRRLRQQTTEQELRGAGLNPLPVAAERSERLLRKITKSSPVADLTERKDWQEEVRRFAVSRFGLTIAALWDWDGVEPMWRLAGASVSRHPSHLAQLYPSGFWLSDDDDRCVLVVDLDFNESDQRLVARTTELTLADAED